MKKKKALDYNPFEQIEHLGFFDRLMSGMLPITVSIEELLASFKIAHFGHCMESQVFYGLEDCPPPTLTGWIRYWRHYKDRYLITYKHRTAK